MRSALRTGLELCLSVEGPRSRSLPEARIEVVQSREVFTDLLDPEDSWEQERRNNVVYQPCGGGRRVIRKRLGRE